MRSSRIGQTPLRQGTPKGEEDMITLKRIALIAMAAVATSTSPALAGTKYAANLVSNDAFNPPANPTLSPKSSIKLSDKGSVAITLDGVTDGAGALVTTSTVYAASIKANPAAPNLDGSEYIVIIKLFLPAIAGTVPLVEVPVPVDLAGGKGKTKLSVAGLLGLLAGTSGRSLEIKGAEVWGPLGVGAPLTNCLAVVGAALPVGLPLGAVCRGGTQFGISGLSIPVP
jgi:hypothetical protein